MNIASLSTQIEIAFWMAIVLLLRDRRIYRLAMLALIALLGLVLMLLTAFSWAYLNLPARPSAPKTAAIQTSAYLKRPDNGQKNLLLIVVDRLAQDEPVLEGAWMLIYAPSGLKVTFMPVYPAQSGAAASLEKVFLLPEEGVLPDSFEQTLRAQGLWWDNYLVVDHATLATLVELSGGIDIGDGRSDGGQVVGLLPIAGQDPYTSQEFQARIARGICQRFGATLQNASPEAIVDLLIAGAPLGAVRSDLTPGDLQASWSKMRGAGGLDCEFPTLIGR